MKKGEITVFLSLTVVLLVSFILGMMNAANIQLMKNQARIDVDSALYSLFGEYQTDLLEEYHIFGIEETYGTGNLQEENLLRRMHYFGTKGIVHHCFLLTLNLDCKKCRNYHNNKYNCQHHK